MTVVLIILGVVAVIAVVYCAVKSLRDASRKVDRILTEERERTE